MAKEAGKWLEDLQGRRWWTEAEARRVLEALERSGESVSSFARGAGLVPQRVSWWRKRLATTDTAATTAMVTAAATFVPVVVRAEAGAAREAAVVLNFGAARMEVRALDASSASWVAQVLRAVAEVPS